MENYAAVGMLKEDEIRRRSPYLPPRPLEDVKLYKFKKLHQRISKTEQ